MKKKAKMFEIELMPDSPDDFQLVGETSEESRKLDLRLEAERQIKRQENAKKAIKETMELF